MQQEFEFDDLCQGWVHSYEEDTDAETVYRPVAFDFPPSRGRNGFRLDSDMSCSRIGIAKTDGSDVTEGTWEIVGEHPLRIRVDFGDTSQILMVRALDKDRLSIHSSP